MLAGKAHMERHNQVAGIEYRNICAEDKLETPSRARQCEEVLAFATKNITVRVVICIW